MKGTTILNRQINHLGSWKIISLCHFGNFDGGGTKFSCHVGSLMKHTLISTSCQGILCRTHYIKLCDTKDFVNKLDCLICTCWRLKNQRLVWRNFFIISLVLALHWTFLDKDKGNFKFCVPQITNFLSVCRR